MLFIFYFRFTFFYFLVASSCMVHILFRASYQAALGAAINTMQKQCFNAYVYQIIFKYFTIKEMKKKYKTQGWNM